MDLFEFDKTKNINFIVKFTYFLYDFILFMILHVGHFSWFKMYIFFFYFSIKILSLQIYDKNEIR